MQRKLDPCKRILEVSLLVFGTGKSLRERRWLCQVLEGERAESEKCGDSKGWSHINRRLNEYRKTIPMINDNLIDLMVDRLQSIVLDSALQRTAEQHHESHETTSLMTLEELQMMLGPTFQAMRETIVEKSFQTTHHRASTEAIGQFLQDCVRCGVPLEYAEILSCLSSEEMQPVHQRILE